MDLLRRSSPYFSRVFCSGDGFSKSIFVLYWKTTDFFSLNSTVLRAEVPKRLLICPLGNRWYLSLQSGSWRSAIHRAWAHLYSRMQSNRSHLCARAISAKKCGSAKPLTFYNWEPFQWRTLKTVTSLNKEARLLKFCFSQAIVVFGDNELIRSKCYDRKAKKAFRTSKCCNR